MTRDEAVKKIVEPYVDVPFGDALVDSLVALGILKLDEPKPASEKAFDIICRDVGGIHADIILDKLRAAGLQIVEK